MSKQIEALKLALEALEANYLLVNGTETHGGLEQCLDGYYCGCFDTDPINKQTEEAINAIKEALAKEKALQTLHDENERLGLYKDAYAQPEQGESVALTIYRGELCYKSQEDDQSFGMWCPVTQDLPFPEGTKFYTSPPQRKPLTDEHPLVVFAKECVLGAYKESELGDAARRAIEAAYNIKGEA